MAWLSNGVHQSGIHGIVSLQTWLPQQWRLMDRVSQVASPDFSYTLVMPLVAALHGALGVTLAVTIILCEWTNAILKRLVEGQRPYWWVYETPLYAHQRPPMVMQYPGTCQTEPGTPSEHAMMSAAVTYVLVSAFCKMVLDRTPFLSLDQKTWARRLLWAFLWAWVILVIIARSFLAANFPHQGVIGAALGVSIASLVGRASPRFQALRRPQHLLFGAALFASAMAAIWYQGTTGGGNPKWALEKAVKWCMKREFVELEVRPHYALSRCLGWFVGLALAVTSTRTKMTDRSRFSRAMVVSLTILNIFASQAFTMTHQLLPASRSRWYLVVEALLNAMAAFVHFAVMPYLVKKTARVGGIKYKKPL